MQNEEKKLRKYRIIIIFQSVLNILLILLLSFFTFNYFKTDKKLAVKEVELFQSDSARAELEDLLKSTDMELTEYKGKNTQLDQFLREKNDSLQEFADRIEAMLRKGKLTREELNKANDELDLLRYYKRKYIGQIDSLNTVIVALNTENRTLKTDINKQKRKNEDLNMDIARLSNKVAIGAKLTTQNVFVTGVKLRTNGKEKETIRVSQMDQLKITFALNENYVTEKGKKDIILKVIGPDGATIYNEIAGSGTFRYQNEESLYSTKKVIDYGQEAQQVSIYWNKGSEFVKGIYKAELFCEGFKIGTTEFELK
jgi:DNA repair ATPase RecN